MVRMLMHGWTIILYAWTNHDVWMLSLSLISNTHIRTHTLTSMILAQLSAILSPLGDRIAVPYIIFVIISSQDFGAKWQEKDKVHPLFGAMSASGDHTNADYFAYVTFDYEQHILIATGGGSVNVWRDEDRYDAKEQGLHGSHNFENVEKPWDCYCILTENPIFITFFPEPWISKNSNRHWFISIKDGKPHGWPFVFARRHVLGLRLTSNG